MAESWPNPYDGTTTLVDDVDPPISHSETAGVQDVLEPLSPLQAFQLNAQELYEEFEASGGAGSYDAVSKYSRQVTDGAIQSVKGAAYFKSATEGHQVDSDTLSGVVHEFSKMVTDIEGDSEFDLAGNSFRVMCAIEGVVARTAGHSYVGDKPSGLVENIGLDVLQGYVGLADHAKRPDKAVGLLMRPGLAEEVTPEDLSEMAANSETRQLSEFLAMASIISRKKSLEKQQENPPQHSQPSAKEGLLALSDISDVITPLASGTNFSQQAMEYVVATWLLNYRQAKSPYTPEPMQIDLRVRASNVLSNFQRHRQLASLGVDPAELRKKTGIINVGRYSNDELLTQFNQEIDPNKETTVMLAATDRWNGVESVDRRGTSDDIEALRSRKGGSNVLIAEVSSRLQIAGRLLRARELAGKPLETIVIDAHGSKTGFSLGIKGRASVKDVVSSKFLENLRANDIIDKNTRIVLASCDTGHEDAIAAQIAVTSSADTIAPDFTSNGLSVDGDEITLSQSTGESGGVLHGADGQRVRL